jgi:hypothetical protein
MASHTHIASRAIQSGERSAAHQVRHLHSADQLSRRLSQYFLAQTALNVLFGLIRQLLFRHGASDLALRPS